MCTSAKWLIVQCFQIEFDFLSVGFLEGGKLGNPEKNHWSKEENQQ